MKNSGTRCLRYDLFIPTVDGSGLESTIPNQWSVAEKAPLMIKLILSTVCSHCNVREEEWGRRTAHERIKINTFFFTGLIYEAVLIIFHQMGGHINSFFFVCSSLNLIPASVHGNNILGASRRALLHLVALQVWSIGQINGARANWTSNKYLVCIFLFVWCGRGVKSMTATEHFHRYCYSSEVVLTDCLIRSRWTEGQRNPYVGRFFLLTTPKEGLIYF